VDTPDLAALVPGMMAKHPGYTWAIRSGWGPGEDLVIDLHPSTSPERAAAVRVLHPGVEVFLFSFAGHESHAFAYDDDDRLEVLQERIDLAVRAAGGPTRLIRESAGERTVTSTLIMDPDGLQTCPWTVSSPGRLVARLRRTPITRHVADFPALPIG